MIPGVYKPGDYVTANARGRKLSLPEGRLTIMEVADQEPRYRVWSEAGEEEWVWTSEIMALR